MNGILELSKGDMKIFAMHFPYRKKVGLGIYLRDKNWHVKVATFNNDESAEIFMEYLAMFCGAERVSDEVKE